MKPKYFSAWAKTTSKNGEEHYVTVVGKLEQTRRKEIIQELTQVETKPDNFTTGVLAYEAKRLRRKLTLGMSICHPTDKFDENVGIEIAKSRIKNGDDLGQLETSNVTMLTEDAIMAEILTKLNHITKNIDKYIS